MKPADGIVVLSPFVWDGIQNACQYTARGLAGHGWPTLYVEPRPRWNRTDPDFSSRVLCQAFLGRRVRSAGRNLHVLRPRSVPLGRAATMRAVGQRLFRHDVLTACAALGITRPVLSVAYYDGCMDDVQSLGGDRLVYRCIDDIENEEERELCRRADVVFVNHPGLLDARTSLNPRLHVVPNGCEFDRLSRRVTDESILSGIPRPRVGLVGVLNHWVNWEWLLAFARRRPDVSLVLVGPVRGWTPKDDERANAGALEELRALGNAYWVGERTGDALTAALWGLDVGLVAFTDTQFNRGRDPLKLYQYLAVGLPVVTSPLSAFTSLPAGVRCADKVDEFCALIEDALSSDARAGRDERVRFARAADWSERIRTADAVLHQHFDVSTMRAAPEGAAS